VPQLCVDLLVTLIHVVVCAFHCSASSTLSLLFDTETLPKVERTTANDATMSSNGEVFFSSDLHQPKMLEHFWESFKSPIVVKIVNGSAQGNKPKLNKICKMCKDSNQPAPTPVKSSKKNKWKHEEIKSLIRMRNKMNDKFQSVNGRLVPWEEILGTMYFIIIVKIKEVNSIVIVLLLFTTVVWSYDVCCTHFPPSINYVKQFYLWSLQN
jgi:hypothetical protein